MTSQEKEQSFKEQVFRMISFPKEILEEFWLYWSEPNRSGTKLRYELEKTWDLNRRLKRWQLMKDQRKDFKPSEMAKNRLDTSVKPLPPKPTNMIEELDQFLSKYTQHPTEIPFTAFAKFYDYMKQEKLLRPMTMPEITRLKEVYNGDNNKCRCACVQMTMDGYVNSGITFADIFKMRQKLTV